MEMRQEWQGEGAGSRSGSVTRESSVVREGGGGAVVGRNAGGVGENQTREAVRQIVIAALRLQEVSLGDEEYKSLVSHTVNAGIFALRGRLKGGKHVGMGEIGEVVESLLKIFLWNK